MHVLLTLPLGVVLVADPLPSSLVGRWTAVGENAKGDTLEFEPADKVVWRTHKRPWSLAYRLDATATPWALDLVGFTESPVAGRTLYCIVERTGDRFRLDCEPGAPTAEGAKKRPAAFVPGQTQEFERSR